MFGHREVVICFDGPNLISVCTETVKIDAKCLRIAADIYYLFDAISAEHGDRFIVDAYAWRIHYDHIGLKLSLTVKIRTESFTANFKALKEAGYLKVAQADIFGKETADGIRVLYGGSAKPNNVAGFLEKEDVDGALVGGASLKVDSFAAMVKAAM